MAFFHSDTPFRRLHLLGFPLIHDFLSHHASFLPFDALIQQDKQYILNVDVPGAKKTDIKINVEDASNGSTVSPCRLLVITAERHLQDADSPSTNATEKHDPSDKRTHTYRYAALLPDDVKVDKISAKLEDGVLRLVLPKEASKPKTNEITIR